LPLDSDQALLQAVDQHPLLDTFRLEAEAREAQAKSEEMGAYPNFSVGADWIITGESDMNPADNGKDAVFVGGGMSLPLWQGNYSDAATAARADARSQRAEGDAARDLARAELEASLSAVRDARRRVLLYTNTLVPQAEAAYASVLGAFVSGRGTVADALLVQRDLLELRVELEKARADHARGWARLERAVGRPVRAQNPTEPTAPPGGP
jgi:outer membrane protein TolC